MSTSISAQQSTVISSSSSSRYTKWKLSGKSLKASLTLALRSLNLLQTLTRWISDACFTLIIKQQQFYQLQQRGRYPCQFKIIALVTSQQQSPLYSTIHIIIESKLQQSLMLSPILALVLLCYLASCQANTTNLMIDAIQPCSLYFTYDAASAQSLFTNCTYLLPGANVTYTDWATCYATCCPGLVAPASSTLKDIQTCVTTYSSTPFLVTLIGILLGLFICLIFVVIPCCCSKDGGYYQIKKAIADKFAEVEQDQSGVEQGPVRQSNKSKEQEMKIIFAHAPGSQYIISEVPHRISISDEIIDDFPSQERKCLSCKLGKSNLRLKCSHYFHNNCLNQKSKELKRCEECSSEGIYPVAAYCSICERRFTELHYISLENTYICKVCEQK